MTTYRDFNQGVWKVKHDHFERSVFGLMILVCVALVLGLLFLLYMFTIAMYIVGGVVAFSAMVYGTGYAFERVAEKWKNRNE